MSFCQLSRTQICHTAGFLIYQSRETFPQIESKWAENTIVMIWVSLILQQCKLIRYEYPKNKLLWNEWNTHFECEWYYMSNFRIYPQIDLKWVKKYSYCIFWCKMSNSYWTKWVVLSICKFECGKVDKSSHRGPTFKSIGTNTTLSGDCSKGRKRSRGESSRRNEPPPQRSRREETEPQPGPSNEDPLRLDPPGPQDPNPPSRSCC